MYIYKIINLVNTKIYIGQCNGKRKNYFAGGKLIKAAIKKEGIENFKKEILVDNLTNQNLTNELEKHYIHLYSSYIREIGYNIRKGGKGCKGFHLSEEIKEKIRQRMIGNKIMLGRKLDEETRLKQSNSQKERLKTTSKDELIRRSNKAYQTRILKYDMGKLVSEGRQKNKKLDWNNNQTKPVVQETKDGKFIKLWASAYQVEKEIGLNSSHISSVCRNLWGFKTHRKYKWRFATENEILNYKF